MSRSAGRKSSGTDLARHLQSPVEREREHLLAATALGLPGPDPVLVDVSGEEVRRLTIRQSDGTVIEIDPKDIVRLRIASSAVPDYETARGKMEREMSETTAVELETRPRTAFSGNKRFRSKAATDLAQLQDEAGSTGTVAIALRAVLDGERPLTSVPALAKLPVKLSQATDVNQRHHVRVANARRLIAAYMDDRSLSEYQRGQAVQEIIRGLRAAR